MFSNELVNLPLGDIRKLRRIHGFHGDDGRVRVVVIPAVPRLLELSVVQQGPRVPTPEVVVPEDFHCASNVKLWLEYLSLSSWVRDVTSLVKLRRTKRGGSEATNEGVRWLFELCDEALGLALYFKNYRVLVALCQFSPSPPHPW